LQPSSNAVFRTAVLHLSTSADTQASCYAIRIPTNLQELNHQGIQASKSAMKLKLGDTCGSIPSTEEPRSFLFPSHHQSAITTLSHCKATTRVLRQHCKHI